MRNYLLCLLGIALVLVVACSKLRDNISEPVDNNINVHPSGWINRTDAQFHGSVMRANGYDYENCTKCHGKTYSGGISGVSCMNAGCHSAYDGTQKSPEACNTCHGNFRAFANDTLSWAPPRSLGGDTAVTSPGVGAHQAHLAGIRLSSNARCEQCHAVPEKVMEINHIDSQLKAEVIFNTSLAALTSADGTYQPLSSYDTLRCSGVYCHGSWKLRRESSPNKFGYTDSVMTGLFYKPLWTGQVSEAECGSCHNLPPDGHIGPFAVTSCGNCHTGIVNANGTIADRSKHINGRVNFQGTERPF